MSNEEVKKLCLHLAYADTEDEVIQILDKAGYWKDESCWRFYGDNENNFATIGNQQSRPESAVVEKMVNSVDAVLMKQCLRRGINPESDDAPRSVFEAVEQFFEVPDGKLSNVTVQRRRELAENIAFVATGSRRNPSYEVIDRGEGQSPGSMPYTLLSLGRSNKMRIQFVQGKFNMGATGTFQYGGKFNIQLIITRRDPAIVELERSYLILEMQRITEEAERIKQSDSERKRLEDKLKALVHHLETLGEWGFTVVRRVDPGQGVRSSTYKYLAPVPVEGNGNAVLSFKSDSLPLMPDAYPQAYGQPLEYGTFIKMYEYQMTGWKTNILFDLFNRVAILLPGIAVPIRFYERRPGYVGHSMEHTMAGLSVRLDEDKLGNLEPDFPTSATFTVMGQPVRATIYAFRKGRSEKYKKDEGVLFVVNGQTHGYFSKDFFARHSVGMSYLMDSILVMLDCSDIDGRAREDLFMNSRDRIRVGAMRNEIESALEDIIKNHAGLRALRERRRREDIADKLREDKPLAIVIERLIKNNPTLNRLFVQGVRLSNPLRSVSAKAGEFEFNGKQYPSFFTLAKQYPQEKPRKGHCNSKLRIQYKTDAANDYFSRDVNPGEFRLKVNQQDVETFTLNLYNGLANLTVDLPQCAKEGDILHFESAVMDDSRMTPITQNFYVTVQAAAPKREAGERTGVRGAKQSDSTEVGDDAKRTSKLDIPNVIEVRQPEWETYQFNAESAIKVVDTGEGGYDVYVNMDNIYLQNEKKNLTSEPTILESRYKYGMVLICIAFLNEYDKRQQKRGGEEVNVAEAIANAGRVMSPILLPMISELGNIEVSTSTTQLAEA